MIWFGLRLIKQFCIRTCESPVSLSTRDELLKDPVLVWFDRHFNTEWTPGIPSVVHLFLFIFFLLTR